MKRTEENRRKIGKTKRFYKKQGEEKSTTATEYCNKN